MQQIGPYLLESKLGEGGMGAVFQARHATGGQRVALKLLRRELLAEGGHERFRREAQAVARISHPHVVRIYEHGQDDQVAWIALELIEGESLASRLRRDGPLAPREAVRLLGALCEGVEAAHAQGVLHRDLKPANVLIRASDGQPLLTDFGLARTSGASQQLTRTGEILGTPSYMPPEQAGTAREVTPAADVYGLGAILYAALSGSPPFRASTVLQVLDQVFNAPPERPSLLRGEELPPELEELCLRCLAKDPAARPSTPMALRRALSGLRLRPPARRASLVLPVLALVAVFVAGAAASLALGPASGASPSPAQSQVSLLATPARTPALASSTPEREAPRDAQLAPLEPIYPPLWPAEIFGDPSAWGVALEALDSPERQLARIEELSSRAADAKLRFQLRALASEVFVRACVRGQNPPPPSADLLRRGHALYAELTALARQAEQARPVDQSLVTLVRLFRGRLSYALGLVKLADPSLAEGAALRDLDRAWGDLAAFNQDPPPGRFGRESVAYSHLALSRLEVEPAGSKAPAPCRRGDLVGGWATRPRRARWRPTVGTRRPERSQRGGCAGPESAR